MESRDLVSVSTPVSRPVIWSLGLGLEGLRSRLGLKGFRSQTRALCLETLHRLFFMKFCKKGFLNKWFYKMIVQNLAVRSCQWLSFLCCCVICEMVKTICHLPRLKFILNSIKNVHAPMKSQRVISATRGWEYFAKDYLWTVFPGVFLWNQ